VVTHMIPLLTITFLMSSKHVTDTFKVVLLQTAVLTLHYLDCADFSNTSAV
jgi:hypothetical protein